MCDTVIATCAIAMHAFSYTTRMELVVESWVQLALSQKVANLVYYHFIGWLQ